MKRWLPSGYITECTHCERDGEAEGYALYIRWGRWIFEFSIARRHA